MGTLYEASWSGCFRSINSGIHDFHILSSDHFPITNVWKFVFPQTLNFAFFAVSSRLLSVSFAPLYCLHSSSNWTRLAFSFCTKTFHTV